MQEIKPKFERGLTLPLPFGVRCKYYCPGTVTPDSSWFLWGTILFLPGKIVGVGSFKMNLAALHRENSLEWLMHQGNPRNGFKVNQEVSSPWTCRTLNLLSSSSFSEGWKQAHISHNNCLWWCLHILLPNFYSAASRACSVWAPGGTLGPLQQFIGTPADCTSGNAAASTFII